MDTLWIRHLQSLLQILIVLHGLHLAFDNLDQPIVILLLCPFIRHATRPNRCHAGSIDCLDLIKRPWSCQVTSILRQEDRLPVGLELSCTIRIARCVETRPPAPFIQIDAKEIRLAILITTHEKVLDALSDSGVIVTGIPHRNGSAFILAHQHLHIANHGFDIGGRLGGCIVVGHFIAGNKSKDVRIGDKAGHDGSIGIENRDVVGGVFTVDERGACADIKDKVQSVLFKHLHASIMVLAGINFIHSDHIGTKFFYKRGITGAGIGIGKWILDGLVRSAWLVRNS